MSEWIVEHAQYVRLGAFVAIFSTMAVMEILRERRELQTSKGQRWATNIGIIVTDSVVLRFVFPMGAIGVGYLAGDLGWGLFNVVSVPFWLAVVASFVLLDFVVWLQHVVFHAVPALWKVHMMHHADLDFDVTTGTRFHPIEMVISMGIKAAAILLLGAPVFAILLFEVLLNGTSMFNHANLDIPRPIDRVLRLFVVTPDMHRVHHSAEPKETNTNFGFNVPWWDYLFGTYRDQPEEGHHGMTIGLEQIRDPEKNTYLHLLVLPFVDPAGDYDISSREIETPGEQMEDEESTEEVEPGNKVGA
jgi:sterol desaturase/sphingolipid hydroxylase (fatty acid hydroxylase superfamily)